MSDLCPHGYLGLFFRATRYWRVNVSDSRRLLKIASSSRNRYWYFKKFITLFFCLALQGCDATSFDVRKCAIGTPQLAFYVNLHRAVIGPSATLTGRWRPDIDLRRMLTGTSMSAVWSVFVGRLKKNWITWLYPYLNDPVSRQWSTWLACTQNPR